MTAKLFTPRASRELSAAERVTQRPMLARVEPRLATDCYRFWSLRGYPYLLVIDTENDPSVVARFVHQTRDLPILLVDL